MKKRTLLLIPSLLLAACSSGGDDGGPSGNNSGSITIALSSTSLTLVQGANGTVNVTVGRAGSFSGAVNVVVQGAPSGVTATAATVAAGATSSTLTLQAGGTVAAGTYPLTVRGSASGVSDATATLSLVVTAAPAGGFTLSIAPASLSVQQGANGQVTVNIARTAPFNGAVALTATGLPSGVTGAFAPASATDATSTLTLTAAAGAATGTTTVTVRGTGTGVAEQTATLSLVVNPTSTGGNGTWRVCSWETQPIWFAVQSGDGPWTRITPTNGAFTFSVSAARGGVAYVSQNSAGGFDLAVFYATAEELRGLGEARCTNNLGTRTVTGTVAGIGATEAANIALGGAFATVLPNSGSGFTLQRVSNTPVDLIASRVENSFDGTTFSSIVRKLIIRRNQNPANGAVLPVLDFNSSEAFDPASRNVTITNLSGEQSVVSAWYQTSAGGFVNAFFAGGAATTATRTWYGIPASKQQAGDLHALQVSAFTANGVNTSVRSTLAYFREATDRTVALGPTLSAPTMSTAATTPYVRFRAQLPVQPEYDRTWGFSFTQGTTGNGRTVAISLTRGWLSGVATVDVAVPDFTGVSGWDSNWGPRTGVSTQWSAGGTDVTPDGGATGPIAEGTTIVNGARTGALIP